MQAGGPPVRSVSLHTRAPRGPPEGPYVGACTLGLRPTALRTGGHIRPTVWDPNEAQAHGPQAHGLHTRAQARIT